LSASGGAGRAPKVRLRTADKRSLSSQRWLERQLNDPYVHAARRAGWRSRAAFKLIELDDRFHLLKPGRRVVDLGAAPGGWTQVAVERVQAREQGRGMVLAIDVQAMDPVPGAVVLHADFMSDAAPGQLKAALGAGGADIVLSDMAAPATGHARTDHVRVVALCEAAYAFAREVLAVDGAFIAKVFQGGAEATLLTQLKRDFRSVRHAKPPASRAASSETYVVAQGFRAEAAIRPKTSADQDK
jgi:23S rRNA (uridine2552-2'-O)-methyltransferase